MRANEETRDPVERHHRSIVCGKKGFAEIERNIDIKFLPRRTGTTKNPSETSKKDTGAPTRFQDPGRNKLYPYICSDCQ